MMGSADIRLPDYRLDGKVAIITGGTKGIGCGVAKLFAAFGADVVISSRHEEECEALAAEIREANGSAAGVACDVSRVSDIENLVDETRRIFGDVHILVNNAGIAQTKAMLDMDEADYDRVMDTNLKSVFFASRAVARHISGIDHGGRIINIASIGGLKGTNKLSTYGMSKSAVLNLTKAMALEWSRYDITATAICPGYVRTDMNTKSFDNEEFLKRTLKAIPQRRLGTVEEVAAVALFLASDYSGMISGSAIIADMGATAG